ncbi:MAG TPA: type II toxin-antitoxin system CcdA family antitoxin [Nitrososphaeraceae archaeon]|nr:type II toxin-antitoxin system CcdA family antitoxin [Nitrososphaeraceae archaeon]
MGFGSLFKKKKKNVESSASDVENKIKKEVQPVNDLEQRDRALNAEKAELGDAKIGSDEINKLQGKEGDRLESSRSSDPDPVAFGATSMEVTVNIDSEVLRKAQAKGIDLSNTLEQQLRRMVSDT